MLALGVLGGVGARTPAARRGGRATVRVIALGRRRPMAITAGIGALVGTVA